jgi:hypothetical protein
MLRPIRTIIVALILGHSVPANADIYQLVITGGDNVEEVAYEVSDASGRRVAQGRTDYLGRFEVNSTPGTYQLIVQWGRASLSAVDLVVDGQRNLKRIQIAPPLR